MTLQLLGGMTVKQFLSRHWQQRPLLVRQAIPDFKGIIQPPELLRLAQRDDVESRWVERPTGNSAARWKLLHGPFSRTQLSRAPRQRWTLLVQGVNLHDRRVDALLEPFSFVPHARMDDVMVSLAAPGGGVGPHVDSYDVFLLQGRGRRRWRVARPGDDSIVPGAPLKVLRRFQAEEAWVLEPGDMLYVPPGWAHDGEAIEACTTYSIGFRAPSQKELGHALLNEIEEKLESRLSGRRYSDRGTAPTRRPGMIPAALAAFAHRAASAARPRGEDVEIALGRHLSEPKSSVVFEPPAAAMSLRRFAAQARRSGVALDARSRLLYRRSRFFLNGELLSAPRGASIILCALADRRALPAGLLAAQRDGSAVLGLLHEWYRAGWLAPGPHRRERDGRNR
jgi:50S ribosomal protein L16 3-hydroxylase